MKWDGYLRDPALVGFVPVERPGSRALVRSYYAYHADLLGLQGPPASGASVGGGRGAHPIVVLPTGERAMVRRYLRGGAVRHLNRDRYFGGHRSLAELRATEIARRAGVRTAMPLAASEQSRRVGYSACFATLWIPDAVDGATWLNQAGPELKRESLHEAGMQIGAMHGAGVAHPDLNLRNLLVTSDGAAPHVYVLDFDRARIYPDGVPGRRRERDLLRMERSAGKLGVEIRPEEWGAFRSGYGAGWPLRDALG